MKYFFVLIFQNALTAYRQVSKRRRGRRRLLAQSAKVLTHQNGKGEAMTQLQVHILVVDDERNIRNNLGMVLEAEGYKVDTASNGDDALLRVKEGRYDIVFVDIQMPKMDGLELLRY